MSVSYTFRFYYYFIYNPALGYLWFDGQWEHKITENTNLLPVRKRKYYYSLAEVFEELPFTACNALIDIKEFYLIPLLYERDERVAIHYHKSVKKFYCD